MIPSAAIALVAYGGLELVKQFTVTGEHAAIQRYGNIALAAFYVACMGGHAVFRQRDWRFADWCAGFVALYLGASSGVFPSAQSSVGMIGGVLVVVWALAFVGLVGRECGDLIGGPSAVRGAGRPPELIRTTAAGQSPLSAIRGHGAGDGDRLSNGEKRRRSFSPRWT